MLMRDEKGRHARSCACALGREAGERKENTPGHLRQVFYTASIDSCSLSLALATDSE